MMFVLFFFLFASVLHSQPSWRSSSPPASAGAQAPAPAGGVSPVAPSPRFVYRDRVVRDTVRVPDTVVVRDTVVRADTLYLWNARYKYVVRYALTSLRVDISNPEWLDYASVSEIVARDTATLRIGSEEIRTLGNIIDQFGNKIPQTDVVTAGFIIQVMGDRVVIEYRGKSSLAMFSGNFDSFGFLHATGEISETGFLASFFPFNLFFGSSRKRIIIEISRQVHLPSEAVL